MQLTFLEAKEPLTKVYSIDSTGALLKDPYPVVKSFFSHTTDITDIQAFYTELLAHAAKSHCLLKGVLQRTLKWESRAGSTLPDGDTEFIVFDIDSDLGVATPQEFMAVLAREYPVYKDVSYVAQYSASYMSGALTHLKCHIFLLCSRIQARKLKLHLQDINLKVFRKELALTKSNSALLWGLDVSACQNDKLIYIAPPKLEAGVVDYFPKTQLRIELVQRTKCAVDLNVLSIPSADEIQRDTIKVINELRKDKDLTQKRSYAEKRDEGVSYMPLNDSVAYVSATKTARGFVYLNISDGDSWAYYHPENNPKFIYNFKGEPTYLTEEFLPDYWHQINQAQKQQYAQQPFQQSAAHNRTFLAFRDIASSAYYNGWLDNNTNELTLYQAKSKDQLADFLKQYGQPVPEYFTDWRLIYDPTASITPFNVIDMSTRTINTFKPSSYMQKPTSFMKRTTQCPPLINKLYHSLLGDDEEIIKQFHNHLAFILRERKMTRIAWVFHGVPGTGKGVLFNYILRPLLGESNCVMKRMEELEERYNEYLADALIVFIDEADMSENPKKKTIMANTKNNITEPTISVRRMYANAVTVKSYVNMMFASNMTSEPVTISKDDRRFSLGEYQKVPLLRVMTPKEIDAIAMELADYANYLHNWAIDYSAVHMPYINNARTRAIANSRTSTDMIADMIKTGDIVGLWDALPNDPNSLDGISGIRYDAYKALLVELIMTKRTKLHRDELMTIFKYNMGSQCPDTPSKFTRFCGHHGLHIEAMRLDGSTQRGMRIDVEWSAPQDWWEERIEEINAAAKPNLKLVTS